MIRSIIINLAAMVLWRLVRSCGLTVIFFLKHWYVDGFFFAYHHLARALTRVERLFALKANAYFLFDPLYQERNIVGYVVGFIYRFLRLMCGGIVFFVTLLLGICGYVLWACSLPYIVFRIIYG